MSPYWLIPIVLIFVGFGVAGYEFGKDSMEVTCQKQDEAEQKNTIDAENHVIAILGKQQTITQEIENAHHTGVSAIDSLYSAAGVLPGSNPTIYRTNAVPGAPNRSDVAACKPSRTKYYQLTPEECDKNTGQLIDLQSWVRQQSAIK